MAGRVCFGALAMLSLLSYSHGAKQVAIKVVESNLALENRTILSDGQGLMTNADKPDKPAALMEKQAAQSTQTTLVEQQVKHDYYPAYHDGMRYEDRRSYDDEVESYMREKENRHPYDHRREYNRLDQQPELEKDDDREVYREHLPRERRQRLRSRRDDRDRDRLEHAADLEMRDLKDENQDLKDAERRMSLDLHEASDKLKEEEKREDEALNQLDTLTTEFKAVSKENDKLKLDKKDLQVDVQQLHREVKNLTTVLKDEKDKEENLIKQQDERIRIAEAKLKISDAKASIAEQKLAKEEELLSENNPEMADKLNEKLDKQLKELGEKDQEIKKQQEAKTQLEKELEELKQKADELEKKRKKDRLDLKTDHVANKNATALDEAVSPELMPNDTAGDAKLISVSIILILAIAGTSCGIGTVASVAYMYRKRAKMITA
mmetsp:Transcript_32077/g.51648  ORF Transcript_32077/g.51648 Transcript_32077/m.51648 type:complete len:436 (-) Transcript_32077:95-1402(-)